MIFFIMARSGRLWIRLRDFDGTDKEMARLITARTKTGSRWMDMILFKRRIV